MIKYWKICNTSDSYREVTHNHITQTQLTILKFIKKFMTANISLVNQVSSPKTNKAELITKLRSFQIKTKNVFTTLNTRVKDMENEDYDLTN